MTAMGEHIKKTGSEIRNRWTKKMPRFFRQLVVLCACVVGTALGVNTMMMVSGAIPHAWWTDVYPLLIGVPTGMAIVCKLTVAGGYKDIDPDNLTRHNRILNKDIDRMHGDLPGGINGNEEDVGMYDIEPYDDRPDA